MAVGMGGVGAAEMEMGEFDRHSAAYMRWVQQGLNRILSLRLAVDGVAGAQTRSAVRRFEQVQHLPADGVVGPNTEQALIRAGAGQPPPAAGPQPPWPQGTPPLIKRVADGLGLTLYVSIPLGSESPAQPMTGLFLPPGFHATAEIDMIVYLHGFKKDASLSIDGYWDKARSLFFPLREGVRDARRNVVLAAPTLGPRSQAPRLVAPEGFDRYAELVRQALQAHGPFGGTRPLRLRTLILACHSGGGLPMRQMARSKDQAAAFVRECWGFDCTYNRGDDTGWASWADEHPSSRLYIYYIPGSPTQPLSLKLKSQARHNVFVLPAATKEHNRVPITHWRERILGSPSLAPI
jgi:hypothetical protein